MAAKSKKQVVDAKFFLVLVDESEEVHQALYMPVFEPNQQVSASPCFMLSRLLNLPTGPGSVH